MSVEKWESVHELSRRQRASIEAVAPLVRELTRLYALFRIPRVYLDGTVEQHWTSAQVALYAKRLEAHIEQAQNEIMRRPLFDPIPETQKREKMPWMTKSNI